MDSAKEKQKSANADVKRLEKDMNDFKNNKEGKIDELKVCARKYASLSQLLTYNHFRLRSRN